MHHDLEREIDQLQKMKRPTVTQKVIDAFAEILDKQDEKGLKKYGVSIDEALVDEDGNPYDWNVMALEECADLFKYLVKENRKLRAENEEIQQQLQKELEEYLHNFNEQFKLTRHWEQTASNLTRANQELRQQLKGKPVKS